VQIRSGVDWVIDKTLLTETHQQSVLDAIANALDKMMSQQTERLVKEIEGEIANKIRRPDDCTAASILRFLNEIRFGTHTQFDSKHRRVSRQTERFQFIFRAAELIAEQDHDSLYAAILDHLHNALVVWENAWGRLEMQRISAHTWTDLDKGTQSSLKRILGDSSPDPLEGKRIADMPAAQAQAIRAHMGSQVLFNVQRQIMLDITSHYWVEHLTAMEVLRQGIGLQSYAQKDPLAEYKVRAYDMFQELLLAIQADIVTALFTYRPRDLSQARTDAERRKPASRAGGASQKKRQRPRKRRKKR
jgi:preprotein translocase subunit SecA